MTHAFLGEPGDVPGEVNVLTFSLTTAPGTIVINQSKRSRVQAEYTDRCWAL